eukprot:TRINITY_DN3769_c0_g7_i4.p1 TRINITY_DN3769_c0_g7~~TRINITY_DN3769_c0_g7_i4.p1  ORF type:complete len:1210 (+),score=352.21 TRINITY_DN3769_c0_g7_i4:102-3731(+)
MMSSVCSWSDQLPQIDDGEKSTVWSIAFKPDGSQLVVACRNRVLVHNGSDGELKHSLRGHEGTVFCVAYAFNGERFASGGSDNAVIIWTDKGEGILSYDHSDPIQSLCYNPVTQQLASCTKSDFGLWSPEQTLVTKVKVPSRICCSAWTNDGQFLALGMENGTISVRNKDGAEKISFSRPSGDPIWSMAWNPSKDLPTEVLAVGSWDQTLSFWQLNGTQKGEDHKLDFDPCSLSYFGNGDYIVMGGSNKKVTLWTKDGTYLGDVCEAQSWVWSVAHQPKSNSVAIGCDEGLIGIYNLTFGTVHSLYQDRYAYRDFMTDVIVQHLTTDQKVRISCKDCVKKISVYKDRLAVQLPNKVVIHELTGDDLIYKVKDKIHRELKCNLLVCISNNLVLCQEKKLQLLTFSGVVEREWMMESVIRYIRVIGGPPGREGLLLGLHNGSVVKVFVNNPFPVDIVKTDSSIRCLDLSANRKKLAVVDENQNCTVYDVNTGELLFEEKGAESVAWNSQMEDMLCFSGDGQLSVKTGNHQPHLQKIMGFVVGFRGSKVYALQRVEMMSIDVPQTASLHRYIEDKDWEMAHKVACLGVTQADWRSLAKASLKAGVLDIARKAFIRVKDIKFIELINQLEKQRTQGMSDSLFAATVAAYSGQYMQAEKEFLKSNEPQKVIDLYCDLRRWDDAIRVTQETGFGDPAILKKRQAEWMQEIGDNKKAARLFAECGEFDKAIDIAMGHSWMDELQTIVTRLEASDTVQLSRCASIFKAKGLHAASKQVYAKMGDFENLMDLLVTTQQWDDAFALAKEHPGLFKDDVFLPYAEWLAIQDRFFEAQTAFSEAGRPELALKILEQLTHNAVVERRYADAAWHYWLLATQHLEIAAKDEATREQSIERFHLYRHKSEVYYSYDTIYSTIFEPFCGIAPDILFNIARFLVNTIGGSNVSHYGVSKVNILYILATHGRSLEAYKCTRESLEALLQLRIPVEWQDTIDQNWMSIQTKPFSDKDTLHPICYRCSAANPLVNIKTSGLTGDCCLNCAHPFIRSMISFDSLPLVEFFLPQHISEEEAMSLITTRPDSSDGGSNNIDGWAQHTGPNADTLVMNSDQNESLFNRLLNEESATGDFKPVIVDQPTLASLKPEHVFVVDHSVCLKGAAKQDGVIMKRYFVNILPEIVVKQCPNCQEFFEEEEFEFEVLSKKHCPFCRQPVPGLNDVKGDAE